MATTLTEQEQVLVQRLGQMAEEASTLDTKRCIEGEPMLWLPHDRALVPGHVYSEAGLDEAKISGCCEYHFDRMFEPGWTDPVTGEPGLTPEED